MYPLNEIIFFLDMCGFSEVRQAVGAEGLHYHENISHLVEYKIAHNDTYKQSIVYMVIDTPTRMEKPFAPHRSWDDMMFIGPHIHHVIHLYMAKSITERQKAVCETMHRLILDVEKTFCLYDINLTYEILSRIYTYYEANKAVLYTIKSNETGEGYKPFEPHS